MMKKLIILFLICFALVGCGNKKDVVKGEVDIRGSIVEINHKENRILVEGADKKQTWVAIHENGNVMNYQKGQEIVVWVDGEIDTSAPAFAKALNIETLSPKE